MTISKDLLALVSQAQGTESLEERAWQSQDFTIDKHYKDYLKQFADASQSEIEAELDKEIDVKYADSLNHPKVAALYKTLNKKFGRKMPDRIVKGGIKFMMPEAIEANEAEIDELFGFGKSDDDSIELRKDEAINYDESDLNAYFLVKFVDQSGFKDVASKLAKFMNLPKGEPTPSELLGWLEDINHHGVYAIVDAINNKRPKKHVMGLMDLQLLHSKIGHGLTEFYDIRTYLSRTPEYAKGTLQFNRVSAEVKPMDKRCVKILEKALSPKEMAEFIAWTKGMWDLGDKWPNANTEGFGE